MVLNEKQKPETENVRRKIERGHFLFPIFPLVLQTKNVRRET